MAGIALDPGGSVLWARRQFTAVAWLRWRLFVNSFRRKGAKSELAARILMVPILGLLVVGPILGGAAAAYYAVAQDHLYFFSLIFWAIFALQIVVSINIAQPGLSFDPEQLIRFPLSFNRYLTIRLFLGLLSTSTVIGTLALFAAATGATVARPSLGPIVFIAALALSLANMLFVRMVFAWVDRWISTRRAREIFTGLIILLSVGFQYLNVTFNPGFSGASDAKRAAKVVALKHIYHAGAPVLRALPPGFAAASVSAYVRGHILAAAMNIAGVLAFAGFFLAIFAWRMRREFSGENLSEAGARSEARSVPSANLESNGPTGIAHLTPAIASTSDPTSLGIPPVIAACLQKEWIYLRRNTAQFYAVLAPLAMVLVFSSRMGKFSHSGFTFPAAVVYSILGICALSYNIFGLDATGIQFYFLAPVDFRSIVLAKNLFNFFFLALDVFAVYLAISLISAMPSPLVTGITLAWVLFAALVNTTIGNIRSMTAPKKMDPLKVTRTQASQMSALLAVSIMLVVAAAGAGLILLGRRVGLIWLPLPVLLALDGVAAGFYLAGLMRVDNLMRQNRESMLEELTRAA